VARAPNVANAAAPEPEASLGWKMTYNEKDLPAFAKMKEQERKTVQSKELSEALERQLLDAITRTHKRDVESIKSQTAQAKADS
jgi:hypothetical protein